MRTLALLGMLGGCGFHWTGDITFREDIGTVELDGNGQRSPIQFERKYDDWNDAVTSHDLTLTVARGGQTYTVVIDPRCPIVDATDPIPLPQPVDSKDAPTGEDDHFQLSWNATRNMPIVGGHGSCDVPVHGNSMTKTWSTE